MLPLPSAEISRGVRSAAERREGSKEIKLGALRKCEAAGAQGRKLLTAQNRHVVQPVTESGHPQQCSAVQFTEVHDGQLVPLLEHASEQCLRKYPEVRIIRGLIRPTT